MQVGGAVNEVFSFTQVAELPDDTIVLQGRGVRCDGLVLCSVSGIGNYGQIAPASRKGSLCMTVVLHASYFDYIFTH